MLLQLEAQIAAEMGARNSGPKGAMSEDVLNSIVDLVYLFAFVWSFGCNLDDASRAKFSEFASMLLGPLIPENVRGKDLFSGTFVMPLRSVCGPFHAVV